MTPQPQTLAPTQTVPRTPVGAFLRYLAVMGEWLKKNLKEAVTVAVVGFVIGWVINFVLMAFFYDGFRADETMLATGQGNVRNGMLIWSLFSSVAFGLIAYRRAVGKERFGHDLANFPGSIVGVFRKDGAAVWTHILWGAAVSLLATFLIARWAGLGVAMVLVSAAFSPLGLILAAMITQLWRAIMRSLMPLKTLRATGSAGLFVGLFTSSLVMLASFFIANEKEKLILGALCLVAAVLVGRRQAHPPTATALLLIAPLLWLLFPELGLADDGGFKEAGGDFGAWAQGGGLGEIVGYSNYGGAAVAIGGVAGWMIGAANGVSPPPEGGWDADLEGEPDPVPEGDPGGEGLPPMTTPIGAATAGPDVVSEASDPTSDPPAPDEVPVPPPAVEEPGTTAAPPALATPRPDGELTDDEIAAMSEEDYRAWRNRTPAGDPNSPAEIMRRAAAGDPEAAAQWEEMKAEGDPSFLDRAASVVLGPVYDAIGGSETLIELAKTDWIDEGLDTAAALRDAAGRRIGQIADTAVETASGAIDLAGMDASEVSGMFGAIGESIASSTVGRIVGDTIDGVVELAGMDADELAGMVGQVRDDAADAVVERIEQAQTLVEGMTVEEAIGHLNRAQDATGEALSDADRAIRRQAQEVMRMNPDTVRAALADGTIAVVEELVVEVATGGLGAARHADDLVDLARGADGAVDSARAAERTSDTARAGTPDTPPVRDTPDAPNAPARPDTPDTPRADAADPAAPPDPAPEGRGPGPTDGARRDPNTTPRDADSPAPEESPPRAPDPEPPVSETPTGRRRGPGDTVELDPSDGPGGVRPPGERPRGPGDTVELDPRDGPGGVRPPEAPRQPTAAAETAAGSPPTRSNEPWTDANTVRTPRRSADAPGDTDPGGGPASPVPPAADAPDGDLVFEMEDGKRVDMTTNRPEPPRPGSPADQAARGDAPATQPRADPGADTLPDGRRGAPVDRAPAGPGEEVRPGVRRAPDGTHQVRMSRAEAERILGDAEPGGVSRTAPTERMPPDATDLDGAPPRAGVSPEETGGRGTLDGPTSGNPVEAARHENAQFREGMERARRDTDGPKPGADAAAAPTPGDERPSGRSRRGPGVDEVPPAPAGPATGRLRDPDLPPDEAAAAARTRAEAMRDDMETIGNSPLDDAGAARDRSVLEAATPAPDAAAPRGRDRAGPATGRLRDPDLPPDEATAAGRARAEAMRDDMATIGNSPLDDAGPPRDRSVPEAATPATDAPAPGGRNRTEPATGRLRDPDLPPDEATAAGRARAEAMRDDMEAIGNSPLDDTGTARLGDPDLPPAERPSGASRSASASEPPPARPESRPGARGDRSGSVDSRAETIAPPDTPPGRDAARPRPAAETPAPDAPADGRGPSRGTPPAGSAPDVPVISGSQGRLLENQTVTARTVTGLDDLGRPISHTHDEVTIPVGQHLRSGSFSDVFASTEGYFGSDPENTLVRISKPISTDAGAQSLRADRIGREALVQVQEEIASPRVLGTFEIMDETGGRRVMEVVENVTVGDQRGVRAADVLRDRAMNIEEAMAYDRATRALNDRGYVSLDLHEGNFTLIDQADGARKLGVFDPGGIMPVRGNDPEVARIIQRRINAPGPDVLRVRPDFSTQIIQEEVRELLLQHVDGEALGIDLNEFIFKPNMGRNHPLVRELFSADDPDALYRQLRGAADR